MVFPVIILELLGAPAEEFEAFDGNLRVKPTLQLLAHPSANGWPVAPGRAALGQLSPPNGRSGR